MDAVIGNSAVKLSVCWSLCYLKGLSQLQCLQYDGKIVTKGMMEKFSRKVCWKNCHERYNGKIVMKGMRENCHERYDGKIVTKIMMGKLSRKLWWKNCHESYDGKIVTKVAVNVFDLEGDVTYSVDSLRMKFETNFSILRPRSITIAPAYFAAVHHVCRTVERNGRETKSNRYCALVSRDCSICTVTRLQALRPKYICSISDIDKYVSILRNVRTGSGVRPPS